jgi:transcriptional regulator with XRE-family HTH domain
VTEGSPGPVIGRNVRALREEQLLSRTELAERSGVSVPGIEHLERGISARPRRRTIEKLAGTLGVLVEDLLSEEPLSPKVAAPPLQRPLNGFLEEERRAVEVPSWVRDALKRGAFVERFEAAKASEEDAYKLHQEEIAGLERAEAKPGTLRARNVLIAKARATATAFLWTEILRGRDVSAVDATEIVVGVIEAQREVLREDPQDQKRAGGANEASEAS